MGFIKKILKNRLGLLITVMLLLLINWLASVYHTRVDLTDEKRFTLSNPTKKILKKLDDVVEVKIFLKGDLPSGFKKLAMGTEEILQEFKEVAGNNLQYSFVAPDEKMENTDVAWGDTLAAMGLYPIDLKLQLKAGEQRQLVYPVALIRYKENVIPVRLYNGIPNIKYAEINTAEALMEYQFANGIYKLSQYQKPMIAYSIGNGEPPLRSYITYDLLENVLRPDYNFFTFNLNTEPQIPDTFKLLMIVKPGQAFTDLEKLKIDQFVMRGGKLLIFMDKLNAEMDSLRIKNQVIAYDRGLQLDDLLFKYGARVNPDLVMDLTSDRLEFLDRNNQPNYLYWPYFPVFITKSNHAINRDLGFVLGRLVNSIDTVEAEGVRKTFLLGSSSNARKISGPALINSDEFAESLDEKKFPVPDIPVAVLLEGRFTSMYKNRLSRTMNDSIEKYGEQFQTGSVKDNKMIIVADGDMILNDVVQNEPIPMGMNAFTFGSKYQYQFANKVFLQNCLEYLIDQSGLSEARAKDHTLRLLDTKKVTVQKTAWQFINIAAPVLAVILFAIIFQWIRKRKYRVLPVK